MRRSKLFALCTVLTVGLVFATGCSRDGSNNDTQAPYEDETNKDVNDMDAGQNGTGMNGGTVDDTQRSGNNLQDAGRNLVDSIEDAGSAIMDGVDNMGNGTNNTNNTNNTNGTNRSGQ